MAQAALSPKHRARNVKGVFSADPKLVCGKTLLLIDDVVTSSASVSAASGALLGAGALAVDVYTLARSDKFRFSRFALLDTGPEVGHVVTGGIKDCFKFGHGLTQQSGAKRWPFYSDVC
jgi:hypoxanthine-guanine phosphoribosyltransferase